MWFKKHSIISMLFVTCFISIALNTSVWAQNSLQKRENLVIVGSSTVYPYAKIVAEAYGKRYHKPVPKIKNEGSGSGFKAFCAGVGLDFPDISNASRPMKFEEWALCAKNGVDNITEVKFGNDGIGLVTSHQNTAFNNLSIMQIYKAIAEWLPVNGVMVRNPYRTWRDISPSLPDSLIQVYGPDRSHGSYSVIIKNIILRTCKKELSYFKKLKGQPSYQKQLKKYCSKMRADGGFNALSVKLKRMIEMLKENKTALFFSSYEALFNHRNKLKAISIDHIEPRIYTISDGTYPLKRPIFFYIKNAHRHFAPNINLYVKEFMSNHAMGTFGYLSRLGLSGLSIQELKKARYAVTIGRKMNRFPVIKPKRY